MDIITEARNTLRFPGMDEKLVQLQQTINDGREQYSDVMPPYWTYECGEIPLPGDVVKDGLAQLEAAARSGTALSPLEQLGHYLLKLKAEAEFVEVRAEAEKSLTRVTAVVEATHFSVASPKDFAESMGLLIGPADQASVPAGPVEVRLRQVELTKASRQGPVGTLDTLTVNMKLMLEVVAPTTTNVRALLAGYHVVVDSPTEALPPTGFPLLELEVV